MLTLVQVFSLLCAFLGLGRIADKDADMWDRLTGVLIILVFLLLVVFIEEVIR